MDACEEVRDGRDETEGVEVGGKLCGGERGRVRRGSRERGGDDRRSWITVSVEGGTMPTNCSITVFAAVL